MDSISKAAQALGKRGGAAGTGAAKVRGDSAYYKAIRARSGSLPDGVTLVPSTVTDYAVIVDSRLVGTVGKNRNGWWFSTPAGHFGTDYHTRSAALAQVLSTLS